MARLFRNSLFLTSTLCVLFPVFSFAATLRVVPSSASVSSGETISIAVSVSSTDQAMNATEGVITFPPNLLQVVSVSKSGSIVGLWVQEPAYSNTVGTVNFEGIALNPGFQGSNGTILTIVFRARAEGSAPLSIADASVLANDGNGTEILTSSSGGIVAIVAPPAKPTPVPKPIPKTPTQDGTTPVKQPEQTPAVIEPVSIIPTPVPTTSIEKPFNLRHILYVIDKVGASLLALLVLLFIILDALVFYHYLRLRKRSGSKLEHAQVLTHRSFLLLRDDVEKFVSELEEESTKRKLSPTEARFVKEMRSDLSTAEKTIVRELRAAEAKLE